MPYSTWPPHHYWAFDLLCTLRHVFSLWYIVETEYIPPGAAAVVQWVRFVFGLIASKRQIQKE